MGKALYLIIGGDDRKHVGQAPMDHYCDPPSIKHGTTLGLPVISYTDSVITADSTPTRAAHITEFYARARSREAATSSFRSSPSAE